MASKYDKRKELKRIRQFFRRALSKGFSYKPDFNPNTLKDLPAYKLHELTADKLYNKVQYQQESGKTLTGKKAREFVTNVNRKIGALKGALTKKKKKQNLENTIKERTQKTRATKEERTTLREEIDKLPAPEKLKQSGFSMEEVELDNLLERIRSFPSPGAMLLEKTLNREIEAYGREAVARSIHAIPDAVKAQVEKAIHYEAKSEGHDAITGFVYLIEGGLIPEMDELKSIGEATDLSDFENPFD